MGIRTSCIACFENNRQSDVAFSCHNCLRDRNKCKRAKCQNWKKGVCRRQACSKVHEDDLHSFKKEI